MQRLGRKYFIEFRENHSWHPKPERKVKCQICGDKTINAYSILGILSNGHWTSELWFCAKHTTEELFLWINEHSDPPDSYLKENVYDWPDIREAHIKWLQGARA